jgi:hypothetical protein
MFMTVQAPHTVVYVSAAQALYCRHIQEQHPIGQTGLVQLRPHGVDCRRIQVQERLCCRHFQVQLRRSLCYKHV